LQRQALVSGSSGNVPSEAIPNSSASLVIADRETAAFVDAVGTLASGPPYPVHSAPTHPPPHDEVPPDPSATLASSLRNASEPYTTIPELDCTMDIDEPETLTPRASYVNDRSRTTAGWSRLPSPYDPVDLLSPSQSANTLPATGDPPKRDISARLKGLLEQTLLAASQEGVPDIVRALFESDFDVDVNATDEFGCTALRAAIKKGYCDIALLLLQHGATFSVDDLVAASLGGLLAVVQKIIERGGVDVDAADMYGKTALCRAIFQGHQDIATFLIQHGATYSAADLFSASRRGLLAVVQEIIERAGVDIDAADKYGDGSALRYAIVAGHSDIAIFLLQHGATCSAADLLSASRRGLLAVVNKIIESGRVDIDAVQEDGLTALQMAMFHKHRDVVDCLLSHGAACQSPEDLKIACFSGHIQAVCIALQRGVPIDSIAVTIAPIGHKGYAALRTSILSAHNDITEYLLGAGAACGMDDLIIACLAGDHSIVQAILLRLHSQGVDFNNLCGRGPICGLITPLEAAHHRPEIAKLLLRHGATCGIEHLVGACETGDVDYARGVIQRLVQRGVYVDRLGRPVRWEESERPLDIARAKGYGKIVELLIEHGAR
jgi:ankyrin repeat protein